MRTVFIRSLGFAFALAAARLSVASSAGAADDAGVMGVLGHFVAAINAGDMKAIAAASAPSADVVDNFPPHHWSGPRALTQWTTGFERSLKAARITEPSIAIARSRNTAVDGPHAFAPLPTIYRYKRDGKAVKETGVLVFALDRIGGAWKIASMSWAPTP